ncbi:MAG: hypothetical protein CO032_04760 [Nitrosopumilales archaeon CG_4_9_14_0_2_um_filter_34_16]|nr:MAG: hypothetical protein CO032_04760 [Nitrosopumilales archaeon CG_4_9_14_0_2_um_filter_34_16]
MNNLAVKELYSEKLSKLPSVNSMLKISIGLIMFTMISFALVYAETIPVDVAGTSYNVDYTATGMTVSGIEADTDFISLIFTVDVTDSTGVLDITFDRSFFDSTFDGLDEDFIILADGDEPTFSETATTAQSRTLSIELPTGTEELEIIGSVFGASVVSDTEDDTTTDTEDDTTTDTEDDTTTLPEDDTTTDTEDDVVVDTSDSDTTDTDQKVLTQCGPGTILQDGECVLDERCGPGTILQDGECVVESTPLPKSEYSFKGIGKEMIFGVVAAFIIAGTVGLVLAIMSKASKSS